MAVGEGKFVLYSRIAPPLKAADYVLTARQTLGASKADGALDADDLPVADLPVHFRVRSPRYALPPDQVLSTFPPANSEGNYGARLPQIVIKRRTLPWERDVGPGGVEATPWLALVVIAEGEAELKLNQAVAECVTPGVELGGVADSQLGNCLEVRKSMIDKIFPTRLDVPLLSHAREVDIHDTELMMGDDDGFLAVVIANRLPLAGKGPTGEEVPVKYLACLINLEQQFETLLERAPEPSRFTFNPAITAAQYVNVAGWDHASMGMTPAVTTAALAGSASLPHGVAPKAAPSAAAHAGLVATAATAPAARDSRAAEWSAGTNPRAATDVYAEMARPFAQAIALNPELLHFDPTYRFPVLLHWSFTSVGGTTFRQLMESADSGLLGTVGAEPTEGRPPVEAVETGHVGLAHRTRRGESVRTWYRGPFVPHPTEDPPEGRLSLAHASDQLRIVVPDGREDLSLASAFEIGRLLALSKPSMVASLLRWRQLHYQTARRQVIWEAARDFLDQFEISTTAIGRDVGVALGRGLARALAERPEQFLGNPRPLVDPGRPLPVAGGATQHLAAGLAIPQAALVGNPTSVLAKVRAATVPVAPAPSFPVLRGDSTGGATVSQARAALNLQLDQQLGRLVVDALPTVVSPNLAGVAVPIIKGKGRAGKGKNRGPASPRGKAAPERPRDALDLLIEALAQEDIE